jgi:hypothetical protein
MTSLINSPVVTPNPAANRIDITCMNAIPRMSCWDTTTCVTISAPSLGVSCEHAVVNTNQSKASRLKLIAANTVYVISRPFRFLKRAINASGDLCITHTETQRRQPNLPPNSPSVRRTELHKQHLTPQCAILHQRRGGLQARVSHPQHSGQNTSKSSAKSSPLSVPLSPPTPCRRPKRRPNQRPCHTLQKSPVPDRHPFCPLQPRRSGFPP